MKPSFHNWSEDRRLKGLVFLVLVLAAIALVAYSFLTFRSGKYANSSGPTTISVRGVGEVTKVPDVATFSFTVHAEDADPVSAQKRSAETSNAIVGYLKGQGITDADTKTLDYNLSPKYEYITTMCTRGGCPPPGNQKIAGYTVDETVQVKVRDTKKAGDLLAGVGQHGATNVSGLAFTVDNDTAAKAEARAKAINDAKKKAQQLADALGVRLTRLSGFSEENNSSLYPMDTKVYAGGMTASPAPVAPQVPAGENTISSAVNLTYEIE